VAGDVPPSARRRQDPPQECLIGLKDEPTRAQLQLLDGSNGTEPVAGEEDRLDVVLHPLDDVLRVDAGGSSGRPTALVTTASNPWLRKYAAPSLSNSSSNHGGCTSWTCQTPCVRSAAAAAAQLATAGTSKRCNSRSMRAASFAVSDDVAGGGRREGDRGESPASEGHRGAIELGRGAQLGLSGWSRPRRGLRRLGWGTCSGHDRGDATACHGGQLDLGAGRRVWRHDADGQPVAGHDGRSCSCSPMSSRQAQCSTSIPSATRQMCMNVHAAARPVTGASASSGIVDAWWVPCSVTCWTTRSPSLMRWCCSSSVGLAVST